MVVEKKIVKRYLTTCYNLNFFLTHSHTISASEELGIIYLDLFYIPFYYLNSPVLCSGTFFIYSLHFNAILILLFWREIFRVCLKVPLI